MDCLSCEYEPKWIKDKRSGISSGRCKYIISLKQLPVFVQWHYIHKLLSPNGWACYVDGKRIKYCETYKQKIKE